MGRPRPTLNGVAQERFSEIGAGAGDGSPEWRWFLEATGGPHAPSRVRAAQDIAGSVDVLDVGCGPAVFFETLSDHPPSPNWRYTGIDGSPEMIAAATLRLLREHRSVELFVSSVEALPLADQSFDAVVARHLLEHVQDPVPALGELARVCRRHLVLVFSQYLGTGPLRLLADVEAGIPRWAHPRQEIVEKLAWAGFVVVKYDQHEPKSAALAVRESYLLARRTDDA